ncbi:hypothetical protein DSO57_1026447 [Entomophthora muscae]|uniref:Uncharacterized protein n=1 Tax=Entomophthora muscae TaxID=34485 RepID=A0ACC2TPA1_9FUNG|nr:hypothetical protein DSO57_1026447 [Entomophthora muscae]
MATIWRELDTGLAIGSCQRRVDASATMVKEDKEYIPHQTQPVSSSKRVTQVPTRRIPQTVTKDISNYDLKSNEEVDKSEKSNRKKKVVLQIIWISSATVGQHS